MLIRMRKGTVKLQCGLEYVNIPPSEITDQTATAALRGPYGHHVDIVSVRDIICIRVLRDFYRTILILTTKKFLLSSRIS